MREDLQTVRDYLSIQEIRYGERLQVEYAVDDAVMPCHIPAMTVQPLVETPSITPPSICWTPALSASAAM